LQPSAEDFAIGEGGGVEPFDVERGQTLEEFAAAPGAVGDRGGGIVREPILGARVGDRGRQQRVLADLPIPGLVDETP
jgi:hypothetical protein